MKIIVTIIILILLSNCSKPKVVLLCGDHACINKSEAEQYFEENLTIEVKIVDKKIKKRIDLVQLNLSENTNGKRNVNIVSKNNTNKEIKTLSNEEISIIKKSLKNKKQEKKLAKKVIVNKDIEKQTKSTSLKKIKPKKTIKNSKKNVNNDQKEVFDVCKILKKCSIDEISRYLLNEGKNKDFPDITARQ